MSGKKDHREIHVMHSGFASVRSGIDSKGVTELFLTQLADRTYSITPFSDLKPGEYLITFRSRGARGTSGYDFGVR
jgi:hypothetical protein